jgi:hypothetical protein
MIGINLEVDGEVKEFNLPENWNEVSVDNFCRIWEFDKNDMTTIEFATRIISSFTDMDESLIMAMNYEDFQKLVNILNFTTEEFVPEKDVDSVELGDEIYYIKKDFNQLTMGEVISIETIMGDANGNIYKVMDKLLCIFLRQKKENGSLETFQPHMMERRWKFRHIPISKVFTLFSFFLTGKNILENNINPSLENQPKKNRKQRRVDLKK